MQQGEPPVSISAFSLNNIGPSTPDPDLMYLGRQLRKAQVHELIPHTCRSRCSRVSWHQEPSGVVFYRTNRSGCIQIKGYLECWDFGLTSMLPQMMLKSRMSNSSGYSCSTSDETP